MLSKASAVVPRSSASQTFLYEPKWDGFRCVVFRDGDDVQLGSRNDKVLTPYFPELVEPLRSALPRRCVVDGELVIATDLGLDFDALGRRIHPARSRIDRLSVETPAAFVAFDMIASGDRSLVDEPFAERRRLLVEALADAAPPVHVTPITADASLAEQWFERFEGAGFDGVMAKPSDGRYESGKRALLKVKHQRTADMVVAGHRFHKDGHGVGSLLLGLFDDRGDLQHVGVASSFTAVRRRELLDELAPYTAEAIETHPWAEWMQATAHEDGRMPGAPNRWNAGKDHRWVPLRIALVAEVGYQGLTAGRLRHPARFLRWRPDKEPTECRYDQLDQPVPAELAEVFGLAENPYGSAS
ncbi:MAG: ATP-dependent DNA ligase [Microthrixaceae bacterium]